VACANGSDRVYAVSSADGYTGPTSPKGGILDEDDIDLDRDDLDLDRHLREKHGLDPVTVAIMGNSDLLTSTGGAKGDLVSYHEKKHDERQKELDHDHWLGPNGV
jgi:hypothetical protein